MGGFELGVWADVSNSMLRQTYVTTCLIQLKSMNGRFTTWLQLAGMLNTASSSPWHHRSGEGPRHNRHTPGLRRQEDMSHDRLAREKLSER